MNDPTIQEIAADLAKAKSAITTTLEALNRAIAKADRKSHGTAAYDLFEKATLALKSGDVAAFKAANAAIEITRLEDPEYRTAREAYDNAHKFYTAVFNAHKDAKEKAEKEHSQAFHGVAEILKAAALRAAEKANGKAAEAGRKARNGSIADTLTQTRNRRDSIGQWQADPITPDSNLGVWDGQIKNHHTKGENHE